MDSLSLCNIVRSSKAWIILEIAVAHAAPNNATLSGWSVLNDVNKDRNCAEYKWQFNLVHTAQCIFKH